MSIYCTSVDFDSEDHGDHCFRWVYCTCSEMNHGQVMTSYVTGQHWYLNDKACDCRCGPIKYDHSNVLPSDDSPREGTFHLGLIPGYIRREGREERDEARPWPWLRVSINSETVLLDREQVQELCDELCDWMTRITDTPPPKPPEET